MSAEKPASDVFVGVLSTVPSRTATGQPFERAQYVINLALCSLLIDAGIASEEKITERVATLQKWLPPEYRSIDVETLLAGIACELEGHAERCRIRTAK